MDQFIRNEQFVKPKIDKTIYNVTIVTLYIFTLLIVLRALDFSIAVLLVNSKFFWIFFFAFILLYLTVLTMRTIYKTIFLKKIVLTNSSKFLFYRNPPNGFIRVLSDKDAVRFGFIQLIPLCLAWLAVLYILIF